MVIVPSKNSQLSLRVDLEGELHVDFVILNQFVSYPLPIFGQILGVPTVGHCSFTNEWSLDALARSSPTSGRYATIPPTPNEIKAFIQNERLQPILRSHKGVETLVEDNQILTRETTHVMKSWAEIIRENAFCLGGNRDHIPACLDHMLYCVATSTPYNLAFFMARRMEFTRRKARMNLPYSMLLTRLFYRVMRDYPHLMSVDYVFYEHVMLPLTQNLERKTRLDFGSRMSMFPKILIN